MRDDLQPDRALTRDDVEVIEGRDQGEALVRRETRGTGVPLGRRGHHDLRSVRAGGRHLDLGRGIRHHHDDADAQRAGGVGEGLPMVAGGVGDHSGCALLGVESGERVRGPTDLERADWLEALWLEPEPVGPGAGQYRRADREPSDGVRRLANVGECDELGHAGHPNDATADRPGLTTAPGGGRPTRPRRPRGPAPPGHPARSTSID